MKKEYLKRVQSVDTLIKSFYDCLGGEPGEPRDWDFFRFLFHPQANKIGYEKDINGNIRPQFISPNEYVERTGYWLDSKRETAFYEREIGRVQEIYGNMAHVLSVCEAFPSKEDMANNKPYKQDVKSIQLAYYRDRWWIINMFWHGVSPEFPIPEHYLGSN
ncbi:hypothetical protein [Flagellimonas flava]|uniref:SnoaL-like domain-containing protein n=1 Tax=Flagellimonas flava TaxID=570519 RepID=A0A1M5J7N4_9FLAO|nr:hypothetical protein [Allomuricauda flava]SHG36319.1 hypothetical protein SAMN04488116_1167 [Allomuricauda flava]